jgi:hypothetical protein
LSESFIQIWLAPFEFFLILASVFELTEYT